MPNDLTNILGLESLEKKGAVPATNKNDSKNYQSSKLQNSIYTNFDDILGENSTSALDRQIAFTFFPTQAGQTKTQRALSLRELAREIDSTSAADKLRLPWLKAARFGDQRTEKNCLRNNANVQSVTGIEIDYDDKAITPEQAQATLKAANVAALIYTSATHRDDAPKWRVVCPLSHPVEPGDRERLVSRLNGLFDGQIDQQASFTLSQSFLYGRVNGNADHRHILVEGEFLDLLTDLDATALAKGTGRTKEGAFIPDTSGSGQLFGLAAEMKRDGHTKAEFAAAIPSNALAQAHIDKESKAGKHRAQRAIDRAWDAAPAPDSDLDDIAFDDLGEDEITVSGFPMTEDGVARAFAAAKGDQLRFCHSSGRWHVWTGTHWRKEETKLAFNWSREICRERAAAKPKSIAARSMSKAATAAAVERFAQADRAFAVTADVWDSDHWLLGTPGGTVNLQTGELRKARQADMITKVTAAAPIPIGSFDANRDCPRWMGFLDQATNGDMDAIRFLQQWAGYSLTGDTREEALLFVHGIGGSGKSTAINTIAALLADYAVAVDTETITAQKHARHSTEIARLHGARMAYASETEAGRAWAENRIKQLTGGDVMTARFMRQDDFSFKPQLKLVIVGNNKPAFSNVDGAIKRRFNVMPFDHKPAAPDMGLKAALEAEFSGILSWAVLGCLDWQRNGLARPAVMIETTEEYFAEQDTFANWLADCCTVGPNHVATTESLFESWSYYARSNGDEPGNKRGEFPQRMRERGFTPAQNTAGMRGRGWRGLKVAPRRDAEIEFDDLGETVESHHVGGEKCLTH